ncbi:MAG: glycosyltransferase family 4 protein [Anaerolineae bacterium]
MPQPRLLLFNLMTDADDPILGFTTTWINALAAHCEAVDVITMQAGRLNVADNVRIYSVGKEKGYSEARRALVFYWILLRLLSQHQYDACFAHMIQLFAVMGAPLLKIAGVPITLWYAHKATGRMLRLAEKLVDRIVTASPESFRLPTHKLTVIGHGVDTGFFQPSPPQLESSGQKRLLTVSRISPVKRIETMIAALKALRDAGVSGVQLKVVGSVSAQDSAYADSLHERVRDLNLMEAVTFAGGLTQQAVVQEYQQSDIFVNMSATGSIDKSVLEAMACGLPAITANEAFQPLLARWSDVLLVPPDSPEVLAARLKQVIAMPGAERAELGAELRQLVVEHHSLKQLVDRLLPILFSSSHPQATP